MTMEALPQDLADFLVTRNFDPEYFDDQGQPTEAGDAKTMKFDYVASSGKSYGTAVVVIADDELSLFYGDNLGRGMEPEDKEDWFSFLEQLSNTAASHGATWSPRDINQLKHTLAGIAAIKEGLFEGYYGTRKISYMGEQTQARLVIKHNRVLGEDDKRYRYVESLFIETAEQERFRLPFKSLSAGRAMLEHVRSGGNPYDVRGNHITEIVGEMAVLSRFNRAQHHRVFEGVTQQLVESARQYYHNLQETVRQLGSPRGYQAYFESWAPDQTGQAEALVENLRDLFVEQTLDARIEAALPTLAKIQQQGNNMKEAEIFENWINNLSEGTWALPDTPETQEKLNQLMSAELIVGPDATNATELLYDLVGDDELFDILNDLADKSQGRANIWDDSDVQRRLAELGVQTPQSTAAEPADVAQDTAPPMAEDSLNEFRADDFDKDDDDDDEDEFPEMFEAPFTAVINGKKQNGTVIIYPGEVTSAEWHLKDTIYIKTGMDNVHDTSDFITHAAEYIQEIIKLDGRGHNYVKHLKKRRGVGEGSGDSQITPGMKTQYGTVMSVEGNTVTVRASNGELTTVNIHDIDQGMAEGDNMSTFVEDRELAEMLKYAGVPIKENVLTDSTGSTLDHILDTYKRDVKDFTQSGEMSRHLEQVLYDYYYDDMPYGAKTGEDIDTSEWIGDRFAQDIGLDEGWKGALTGAALGGALGSIVPGLGTIQGAIAGGYAGHRLGDEGLADPDKEYNARQKLQTQQPKPVSECNYTMEGEYCPEHGLAECGMADGGAVGMPYSMGEELNEIGDTPAGRAALQSYQDKAGNQVDNHWKQVHNKSHLPTDPKMAKRNAGTVAAGNRIHGFGIAKNQQDKVTGRFNYRDAVGKTHVYQKNDPLEQGVAEGNDDPINSNSAMTGSYYEGKETKTQEGDALLARIKSLALLR